LFANSSEGSETTVTKLDAFIRFEHHGTLAEAFEGEPQPLLVPAFIRMLLCKTWADQLPLLRPRIVLSTRRLSILPNLLCVQPLG